MNQNINTDSSPAKTYVPKKKYSIISSELRKKFIQKVISKEQSMVQAAKSLGIKFSTGKAIFKTFKKDGRIGKKTTRNRKTKNSNASVDKKEDPEKTKAAPTHGLTLQDFGPFGQQFLICQQLINNFFTNTNELGQERKCHVLEAFIKNLQMLVINPDLNLLISNLFDIKKSLILQQQQQQLQFASQQSQAIEQSNLLSLLFQNHLTSVLNVNFYFICKQFSRTMDNELNQSSDQIYAKYFQ